MMPMPRYHFHLDECGVRTCDDEGSDHATLNDARAVATTAARAIMCEELKTGHLCLSCHIDIADPEGTQLARLQFADAVKLSGVPKATS